MATQDTPPHPSSTPHGPLPVPFPALVHPFPSPTQGTCAYELVSSPQSPPSQSQPRNALVFVGGLGDGPHTVTYIRAVAARLASAAPHLAYSVFEVRMASSFSAFGYGSLAGDARDLAALVAYLRDTLGRERVVFMGHSTGCQDCVEYADYDKHPGPQVDGFIMQGPVSDREAFGSLMAASQFESSRGHAAKLIAEGRENEMMPRNLLPPFFTTPVTAYRWHSLVGVGGDDDFFSSDLPDDTVAGIWSRFRKPVLVLPSGEDEYVPTSVNFGALLARWQRLAPPGVVSGLSGFIPGASHSVTEAAAQEWTAERVVEFLASLEEGV